MALDTDSRIQLEIILFTDKTDITVDGIKYKNLSKGERLLVFFGQPPNLTWGEFIKQEGYV